MFEINKNDLVGKGNHQECYIHPNKPNLCVKILVSGKNIEIDREKNIICI